ncbi:TRAP transporter small permease [Roseibium suaedae]|uniref:TRAP transporter small permease protein n=1 Tax=Roseibium suaedae TaxID=735517 RepID=A0A1M7HB93_9HYPH|nr:TRAP transporter small permease subunit [Roseibium suaedae]SHM25698.1 TRAP-type C4-dicarboxylate transport system, small permease component [Roseibium suaedae]
MTVLLALARTLGAFNAAALALGRWLGAACIGAMVIIIIVQVIFRYGLGNALPWTEEAARFLMLWMTGLMAPTAFRRGGFVSVDMVVSVLPRALAGLVSLLLLVLTAIVLWKGLLIGWSEVTGFGGRFTMAAIKVPASFDFSKWMSIPRSWMLASLAIGVSAMFSVCLELILRSLITLFGGRERLPAIPMAHTTLGAE